jgi:hypothetical protein
VLLDVSRHGNRFDVLEFAKPAMLAPVEKFRNRVVIRNPGVLVPNRNGKELKNRFVACGPTSAAMAEPENVQLDLT